MEIILVRVVVGDIDILILVEAVCCEKVVGFVTGKCDPLQDKKISAPIVDKECQEEKHQQFLFRREFFYKG
jgi:hypothetical protein